MGVTRFVAAVPGGVGKGIVRPATGVPFCSQVAAGRSLQGGELLPVKVARLTHMAWTSHGVGPAAVAEALKGNVPNDGTQARSSLQEPVAVP